MVSDNDILTFLRSELGGTPSDLSQITPQTNLKALGLDSLDYAVIGAGVEERYNVILTSVQRTSGPLEVTRRQIAIQSLNTVQDIIDLIQAKLTIQRFGI